MDATTEEAPKSLFRLKMKVLPLPQEIKTVLPTLQLYCRISRHSYITKTGQFCVFRYQKLSLHT